jgi:hypothetical protein
MRVAGGQLPLLALLYSRAVLISSAVVSVASLAVRLPCTRSTVTACLQNTPNLSDAVAHLGTRHRASPPASAYVGPCCGQDWWSARTGPLRGVCNPGAEPSDAHLLRAACALHQILTPQTPSCQPHHPLTLAAVIVTVGAGESSASIGVSRSTKQ